MKYKITQSNLFLNEKSFIYQSKKLFIQICNSIYNPIFKAGRFFITIYKKPYLIK